jgi:large subunit ribosomal protein L6
MSRVGRNPITKLNNVQINISDEKSIYGGQLLTVKGPKGELTIDLRPDVKFSESDNEYIIDLVNSKKSNYHGLYRTLVMNAIVGVTQGFEKELEIVGIGYKAEKKGNDVSFTLGLNHPILFKVEEGVSVEVKDSLFLKVSGIDKQKVGETAAQIRKLRKPEPYKGKGIKYSDEIIRRKAGKTAASK